MHIEAYLLLIPTVYYNMTFDSFNRPWTNFYKMDLKNGFWFYKNFESMDFIQKGSDRKRETDLSFK